MKNCKKIAPAPTGAKNGAISSRIDVDIVLDFARAIEEENGACEGAAFILANLPDRYVGPMLKAELLEPFGGVA